MENLKRNDIFVVSAEGICSSIDYQVLSLLYQPIIGQKALGLYYTLLNLVDRQQLVSEEYLHTDLESLLNLDIASIQEERFKLEAIGLLVTFFSSDNFTYEIKLPLSARSFVNDGVLGEYLISNITKTRFKKIIKIFKVKKTHSKQKFNISKAFNEVFPNIDTMYKDEYEPGLISGKSQNYRTLNGHDIDWRFLSDSMPEDILDVNKLTDAIKHKIVSLSYVYDLDEMDIKEVLIQSLNDEGNINIEELARKARHFYESKQKNLNQNEHNHHKIHQNKTPSNPKDTEEYFETISPKNLLAELGDGIVVSSDLVIAERLMDEVGLTPGVINVLLAYIYKQKDNKLPGYAYFQKVGLSWKRNKISSVKLALDYIKHIETMKQNQTKPSYKGKPDKADVQVEWLDKYLNQEDS